MVTGVETAGLVLAAFPLIVDGLSHYIDGVRTMRQFFKFRDTLDSYVVKLTAQQSLYRRSLEVLFVRAGMVESEELDIMIEDPECDLWKDSRRDACILAFLGSAYKAYLETVELLSRTFAVMQDRLILGFESSEKVSIYKIRLEAENLIYMTEGS